MKKIKTILRESTGGMFSDAWYDKVSSKIENEFKEKEVPTVIDPKVEDDFFVLNIKFNERIQTGYLFSMIQDPFITPKKMFIDLKLWCKKNGYRLLKGNSNGKRFVIVFDN